MERGKKAPYQSKRAWKKELDEFIDMVPRPVQQHLEGILLAHMTDEGNKQFANYVERDGHLRRWPLGTRLKHYLECETAVMMLAASSGSPAWLISHIRLHPSPAVRGYLGMNSRVGHTEAKRLISEAAKYEVYMRSEKSAAFNR